MRAPLPRPIDMDRDRGEVVGSGEFVQQSLRRLQIGSAKSFGEPVINRRQQIARLTDAVPVAQQPGEARRGAEFPGQRTLPIRALPKVILRRLRDWRTTAIGSFALRRSHSGVN
jgi:hypothetical protein